MNGREKSLKWPSATLERDLKLLDRDHTSTKSLFQNSDLLKLKRVEVGGIKSRNQVQVKLIPVLTILN